MLGTGLSASSLSESTMPSRMSSSSTVGTYCRQIGSSGDLIRSTIAGEIRNSKFSAACRSRSRSGKCSGPNLAASRSSDRIELLLSTSCQVSMTLPIPPVESLNVHHLVVARRVEVGDPRGRAIAARLVEPTRGCIVRPAGCRDHDEAGDTLQPVFHRMQQGGADASAVQRGVDRHPVEIEGAKGAGGGPPADPAGQASLVLGTEGEVVGGTGHRAVEDLEGHRDLVGA